jgi:hypothetical protein
MLYNAEVWPIRADELRMLEGTYLRMVRGAKDVGPAGESAVPEEATLGWSCSAAERWRSAQGHGEAACTQVEYVDCVAE